jgi:hypothetical protein
MKLFRGTVAVYCENHTEHTDTVRTSQETHYVSATETSRLMLFTKTVAVYYENHTEHTNILSKSKSKLYYNTQSVGQLVSGSHLGPATNFSRGQNNIYWGTQ